MDNRTYYYNIEGEKIPNLEAMTSFLLDECVLGINSFKFLGHDNKTVGPETLALFVNVNDVFGPGADAEEITCSELPILFDLYREKGDNGTIKWAALKRNKKPWPKMIEYLKKKDAWDSVFEGLPDGYQY